MAAILGFMADDDPSRRERGAKLYNESRADFEAFVRKTGRYKPMPADNKLYQKP
jgi:hypothetical protein